MDVFCEMAPHLAYDIFSQYKFHIVNLVFPKIGFWIGDFFLIAPFPDHCVLLPFHTLWSNTALELVLSDTLPHSKPRVVNSRYRNKTPFQLQLTLMIFLWFLLQIISLCKSACFSSKNV